MFKYTKTYLFKFFYVLFQKVKNPLRLKPSLKLTSVLLIPLFLFSCHKAVSSPPQGNGTFLYSGNKDDSIKLGEILKGVDVSGDKKTHLWIKNDQGYIISLGEGQFSADKVYVTPDNGDLQFYSSDSLATSGDIIGTKEFSEEDKKIIAPYVSYFSDPRIMSIFVDKNSDPHFLLIKSAEKTIPRPDDTHEFTTDGYSTNPKYSGEIFKDIGGGGDDNIIPATSITQEEFTAQFPIGWSRGSEEFSIRDKDGNIIQKWPL